MKGLLGAGVLGRTPQVCTGAGSFPRTEVK